MNRIPLGFLCLLIAMGTSVARAGVPYCEAPPSFVDLKPTDGMDLAQLPARVFVARTVEIWATNKGRGLQLLARHNFKSMKSQVLCSRPPEEGSVNMNAWVPTLLDRTQEKQWGDSVWQIFALSEAKRVGIWSQKSRLAPKDEARRLMQKGIWRPLDLESFELVWDQEAANTHLYLRVVYDVMAP